MTRWAGAGPCAGVPTGRKGNGTVPRPEGTGKPMGLGEYDYSEPILLPEEGLKSSSAIQITEPVLKSYPKLKLYPNPAKGYVIVDMLTGNLSGAEISLFDNLGKLVYAQNIPAREQQYIVSLKGIKTGIYILQLRYDGKLLGTEKLTINR